MNKSHSTLMKRILIIALVLGVASIEGFAAQDSEARAGSFLRAAKGPYKGKGGRVSSSLRSELKHAQNPSFDTRHVAFLYRQRRIEKQW